MPSPKTRTRRRWLAATLVSLFALAGLLGAMYSFAMPTFGSLFSTIVADGGVRVTRAVSYGANARQKLDIYRSAGGVGEGPVALFIYGGGWRSGDRRTYGFVGAALARSGMTTVIADYRLFPQAAFPVFVEDAAAAYRWVAENLALKDGVRRPIIVIGHSAGAHIGALLSVDRSYLDAEGSGVPRPAAFIGLAGPYSFDPTTYETTRDIFAGVADSAKTRPTQLVTAAAPPALVMHGLDDTTVKLWNTRTFAQALSQAGVRVEEREFEGLGHIGIILSIARPFRWRAPVLEEIKAFIETVSSRPPS